MIVAVRQERKIETKHTDLVRLFPQKLHSSDTPNRTWPHLPCYQICVEFSLMQLVDMPRPRQPRSLFSSETVYLKFVDDAMAIVVAAVAAVFDDRIDSMMYCQRVAVKVMQDLLTGETTNVVMPVINVWVIATDQVVVAHKVQVCTKRKKSIKEEERKKSSVKMENMSKFRLYLIRIRFGLVDGS